MKKFFFILALLVIGGAMSVFGAQSVWYLAPDGYAFPERIRPRLRIQSMSTGDLPEPCVAALCEKQRQQPEVKVIMLDCDGDKIYDWFVDTGKGTDNEPIFAVFRKMDTADELRMVFPGDSGRMFLLAPDKYGWLRIEVQKESSPSIRERIMYEYSITKKKYHITRHEIHDDVKRVCTVKVGDAGEPFKVDSFALDFEKRLRDRIAADKSYDNLRLFGKKKSNGLYVFEYSPENKNAPDRFTLTFSHSGKAKSEPGEGWTRKITKLYGIRLGKPLFFHCLYRGTSRVEHLLKPLFDADYTLYVTNRSRDWGDIDLRVSLDDQSLIARKIKKDKTWFRPDYYAFPILMNKGKHTLVIEAGEFRVEKTIDTDPKSSVGVVDINIAAWYDIFGKYDEGIKFREEKKGYKP